MRNLIAFAAAAAAMAVAGVANAGVLTLTNATATSINGGQQLQFSNSEVTLVVSAGTFVQTGQVEVVKGANGARPVAYSPGVGLLTTRDDNHAVDGSGKLEALILEFSKPVVITGLTFSWFGSSSDFDLFFDVDLDGLVERVLKDIKITASGFVDMTGLFSEGGVLFGVGANSKKDYFKLKKVHYELLPEVPLPAALPLFLAGLAGLGFAGRRRKAVAV